MKSLLEKRSVVMEQQSSEKQRTSTITHQFNVYLKLLFGQDLNLQDELLLSNQWGKFNQKKVQSPQGVLCFPNPDHKSQKIKYVKPFEFLRFLDKCILGQNNQQKQLFIYCIYQVFKNLEAGEDPQNEKSSFQSFVNQDTINDSQDVIQDMTEQFKQNIRKIKKSKYCDYLKLNIEELISLDDKKMNYGKYYQLIHKQWLRSGKVCSDYLTLTRNIVLIILAKNGFHTDLFFSEDGAQIYCLLELDENNLTKVASKHNIMKQINISFFDLFSFEPVDKNLRPFRLNNRLWKLEEYKVSETLNYLRPKIIELLDEINFKQLAREVNQAGINQQQFQYGKVDLENDYVGPTDNEWIAYYHWLVNINKLVQLIRDDYRLDNDTASLLQNQVQPFQLFLARYRQQYPHITKLNIKQEQNQKIYQIFQEFKNQHLYLLDFYKQFSIFSGLPINKQIKLIKKEELATGYLKAFKDSMTIANHQHKLLFNIWDRLNIKPFTPFLGFQFSYKTLHFQLTRQINFWQKYQINEQNQISLFSTSERLKLLQLALNQILNVNDLIDMGYAKLFCIHDYYELYGNCNNYYEQIKESSNFYEKKIFAIKEIWKFNSLWVIPQDMINQYFGQKVGLYFYYLSYFTFMMFPISIFGFILSILQWTVDDSKEILTFVFSIIQMQWTNLLDDMWEEKQRIFNLREGQSDKHQKSTPRGNYVGSFGRSIESDNLNVFVSNSLIQNLFISALILFLIILTYFGLLVGLFNITLAMKDSFKEYDYLSLDVTITASINIILIHIFEIFYDRFVEILTNYENHQSIEAYETSFIIKIYILEFTSYISPLMFISYLNHPIKLYCFKDDCQLHAEQHFATLIIWLFFFRTIKYIYFTMQSLLNRININNKRMKLFIEDQANMKPYTITQERYGTLDDMRQLFIYITLLSLFGYTFPISFFLVFLQSIAQIQADRAKFLYILQRPWPQNENTLGIWKVILKLIAYICLLSNSGSATIIYVNRYGGDSLLIFVLILFSSCGTKFFMGSILGPSFYIEQLVQRQKNLLKQTFYQFKKKKIQNSQQIIDSKRYVIYKIYNTINILEGQGRLQTISSRSNLSDRLRHVSQQSQVATEQDNIFKRRKTKKKSALLIKIDQTIKQQNTNAVLQFFKQRNFNQQFKFQIFQGSQEKKENLREKLYQFNYKLLQLANYKFLWTERRYSTRYLHLKRKHQMIRNLDWRKTQIVQQQHKLMIEDCTLKAEKKFRKKIQSFCKSKAQDDQKELQILKDRYSKFVEKHSWLQTRKVVVLKVKGLWFNRNRKQVKKQQSLLTIYDFIRKCRMMDKVKNDSYLQTQFDRKFDFSELHLYNMRKYMELFSSLDIIKQNEFTHPQSTKPVDIIKLYSNHLRSQDYRYWCEQIKDTFIFDIQNQKLQEIALIKHFEEVFPFRQFKLIKLIQNQIWNAQDQNGDYVVIKYIKAKINDQIKPFSQSHANFGVFYSEAIQLCHLGNIVDQIDEFNYKGYILNIHKITGFKTLEQVIKYRNFYGFPYTEKQLKSFIHANLILFKEKCYGDISSKNYYYHKNQYALLYPYVDDTQTSQWIDCQNLVKVVLEMMNYHDDLSEMKHQLKSLLEDLTYDNLNMDQILEDYFYQYESKFIEMDIFDELQVPQYSLKDKIQENLHKLHIYQKFNQNAQFEEQNSINSQLLESSLMTIKDIHEDNLEKLIFDIDLQKKYITNTIVSYIKFQNQFFQLDILELKKVIQPLKVICRKIKQIIKELSLQFDCSRLSNSQKKIVLNVSAIEIIEQSIIKRLRKHQAYIDKLQKFNKKIQRYLNQMLCIKGLYYYWERDFNKAIKIINKCIHIQTDIILFNKDLTIDCSVNEIQPEDLNFLQNTPREMQFIHPLGINYKIKELYQQMPKHTMQYIYYKYLLAITMIDQNPNSNHHLIYKEFCDLELDSESFIYWKQQIMCLVKEDIPNQFIFQQNECIIGQYIVNIFNKWMEQYQIDRELVYYQDEEMAWFQIMNASFIARSKNNQEILKQILIHFQENHSVTSIQIKIRCLHLLLHFEDNQMPNFINNNRENDFNKIIKLEDSKIYQLKVLYHKYFYSIIEQFQHRNLLQFRTYQFLSIILIYSPKYYENFSTDEDNYFVRNAINQELEKVEGIDEIEYQLIKRNLIQQNFNKELVLNQSDTLQIKIYKTYFVLQQEYYLNQNFINFFDRICDYFPKKRSLLCLIYIQYHIYFNSKEVAELMVNLCRKLIEFKAPIFKNHHQGFAQDLIYLELQLNNQSLPMIQQHFAIERTDVRDNQQMQIFQDNVQAFLYNFIYQYDFEMQFKIVDNHLQQLVLIPKREVEQLIQVCQTYQIYLSSRLGYDLELVLSAQNTQEPISQIMICHFNARYYLQNYDFDRAYAMSKQVINFIYSLQIDSYLLYKQTPDKNIFYQNDIVRIINLIEEPIYRQNSQIEPQLFNLIDKEFIQFSILLHLDISIQLFQLKKLYIAIPQISALFDLFEMIENDEFINYLLKVYSEYFTLLSQNTQYHIQIQQELLQSVKTRVKKLNKKKHLIRQEFLKKQLTIPQTSEDKAQLDYKISLIDFQVMVFRCKDVNQKAFLHFSINVAEKALQGYQSIAHKYKQDTLSEIIHLQILLALNYKQLGLQFISKDFMINAENNLNKMFQPNKKYPLKAYYFYRMGQFQRLHHQILQSHLQELINHKVFTRQELKYYFYNLAIGNRQVSQIVDHYFTFNDLDKYQYQIKEFLAYSSSQPYIQNIDTEEQISLKELLQGHQALDFTGNDYFLKSMEIMAYCKQDNWMAIQLKK